MNEDQLAKFWNELYDWADLAIDYGLYPDEVANKAVELIKQIQGEE